MRHARILSALLALAACAPPMVSDNPPPLPRGNLGHLGPHSAAAAMIPMRDVQPPPMFQSRTLYVAPTGIPGTWRVGP
jgi:hypothetical protein